MSKVGFGCLFALTCVVGSLRSEVGLIDRVAVVRNTSSPVSEEIAGDYLARRGCTHLIDIYCQDSARSQEAESISLSSYRRDIEDPVSHYLKTHAEIDFVVLTKGVPIRILGGGLPGGFERFSVDSRLAALGYAQRSDAQPVDVHDPTYDPGMRAALGVDYRAVAWANRFWNARSRFSHQAVCGYLVTRLDGYTVDDARALISRSIAAERGGSGGSGGVILLNACPTFGFSRAAKEPVSLAEAEQSRDGRLQITDERSRLAGFNAAMVVAKNELDARSIPSELAQSGTFIGGRTGLMGYASWGSNDSHFDANAYGSLSFAPGAIAETAVSTSARTFLHTNGGQSLIADLIKQGVTGVKGYVDEPLVQGVASPAILFERYTRGWTLAESFYAASAMVGWEDIVVGDPICCPYAKDVRR